MSVTANDIQRTNAANTPERGLFGYSSGEDYLFGTSSVLTRNVRFTGDQDVLPRESFTEQENQESVDIVPRPAFIVNTKPAEK